MRAVKRGVEAGDLRHAGKCGPGRGDARQIVRLVQRRERDQRCEPLHGLVGDQDRRRKVQPAMDDAMADGGNPRLRKLLLHHGEDRAQRTGVVGDEALALERVLTILRAGAVLHGQVRIGAEPVDLADGGAFQRVGREQGEFQRRRAGIDGEDMIRHRGATPLPATRTSSLSASPFSRQ